MRFFSSLSSRTFCSKKKRVEAEAELRGLRVAAELAAAEQRQASISLIERKRSYGLELRAQAAADALATAKREEAAAEEAAAVGRALASEAEVVRRATEGRLRALESAGVSEETISVVRRLAQRLS